MNTLALHAAVLLMSLGLVNIDGTNPSGGNPPMVHVFGGQRVKVDMAVKPLNTNLLEPLEIQADLYQKGQALLAPIQKDIVVAKASRFDGCGQLFLPLISWELPVPEVKRETEMVARLRMKSGGGEWLPSGQISITVYPLGFAKEPLAAFSKKRGFHLFGKNKPLRAFLKDQKVEFDDAGENLAVLPNATRDNGVYIGEATSRELAEWLGTHPGWRGHIVVFCPDSPLLPGVFVSTQGGFRIAKVTLPLLDTLSSDPRSQKTFLEILNTLTAPQF